MIDYLKPSIYSNKAWWINRYQYYWCTILFDLTGPKPVLPFGRMYFGGCGFISRGKPEE